MCVHNRFFSHVMKRNQLKSANILFIYSKRDYTSVYSYFQILNGFQESCLTNWAPCMQSWNTFAKDNTHSGGFIMCKHISAESLQIKALRGK